MSKIAAFYDELARKHGRTDAAVDAGSSENQRIRRQVLADFCRRMTPPAQSVLEVGCGYGALVPFLPESLAYTGIDISSEMIHIASAPRSVSFHCADARELRGQWDLVVTEGIFYKLPLEHKFSFSVESLMERLWGRCRLGLAICTRAITSGGLDDGELRLSAAAMFMMAKRLAPFVTLRHDFLQSDFCVEMYRHPNTGG